MLIDSHIHVGQYDDDYYSPSTIHRLMEEVHVDYFAVSSTTMCEEDYQKVLKEFQELIELDGDKVLPVMWITPEGLKGNIAWFLEANIKWKCLKVHPFLHQKDWQPEGEQFSEVIDIARELKVPLLIHTGCEECCQCGRFEQIISINPDIQFILAHGRPLAQAIRILKQYSNAYADSAFMPINDMHRILREDLSHKLLWGTDMCIPKYFYPHEDIVEYYRRKLITFRTISTPMMYERVTFYNAKNLFKISRII